MIDLNKVRLSDLWYVIGYIATDGYLSVDGRHINITSKDRDHLYLIREALFLTNKIGKKARAKGRKKEYSQLQFGDVAFFRYLVALGLTPHKSLTLGPLNISNVFFSDFLRGVIDGDGNISTWIHRTNRNRQWCLRIFSASEAFIKWLNKGIADYFGIEGKLYFEKRTERKNGHFVLKYGKKSAIEILGKLYYEEALSLKRKHQKAKLCLQVESKSGKLYL